MGIRSMRRLSFAAATILVVAGILISLYGIAEERMKPIAIGLVLIFGSGVFATLYLGTRRRIEL
jgi:hypothetical protein